MNNCKVMELLGKKVKPKVNSSTTMCQDNMPEMLGNILVVNAPFIFQAVWAVTKLWIDAKTRDKVKILGKNYHKKLEKYCDKSQLPDFLCGDITDWPKTKMPWDDYSNFCKKKKTFYHNSNGFKGSDPWMKAQMDDLKPIEDVNNETSQNFACTTMMKN